MSGQMTPASGVRSCSACFHRPVCRIRSVLSSAILDIAIAIPDGELAAVEGDVELAIGSRCQHFSEPWESV